VRDDVAARMTVRTIEIARDTPTLSRAEAFAQAMREIRNDPSADSASDALAHPNAWAPFTLIGVGAGSTRRRWAECLLDPPASAG